MGVFTVLTHDGPLAVSVEQPALLNTKLAAGVHELTLRVRPTEQMTRLLVFAAGREIGRASFHASMAQADGHATWTLPFIVHVPGLVCLKVCISQSFHGQMEGRQLQIRQLLVQPVAMHPRSTKHDELPGISNLDLWGWTSLAWEGHGHRFRVGEAYIRQRGVIEPWKWGCNFTQSHAYAYLPWHLEMVRFLHEHDFLIDEHGFPPQRRLEKKSGRYSVFRVHVQGSRLLPKHLEHRWPTRYVLANTLAFVEKWGRGFSNALREGWRGCIDGWEVEEYAPPDHGVLASAENVVSLLNSLWKYNPGVCLGSCNHTAGYKQAHYVWLHEGFHGPNFVHVAMDAGSIWKVTLPGYDDHVPMGEFAGARSFRNEFNDIFLGYQADSRTYSFSDIGNLTWPDWLIKQSFDYCRMRNLGDAAAPPSALFWLNEGARLLPEEIREYAYIACMDVPRVAVAMKLTTTGLDGRFHWLADAFKDYLGDSKPEDVSELPSTLALRTREWDTATTAILQNNHLRLERDAHCPGGRLRFDPQGIAHFDLDSLSFPLAQQMFSPSQQDDTAVLQIDDAAMSRTNEWEHTLPLDAGMYAFHIVMDKQDQRVLALHVNGRIAGIVHAARQRVNFSLPIATPCTLALTPWQAQADASTDMAEKTSAGKPCAIDIRLMHQGPYPASPVHEAVKVDTQNLQVTHCMQGCDAQLPAKLGRDGTQLVDWHVDLQPGDYLIAITASASSDDHADSQDECELHVGLDRHRHVTRHFAGLKRHESVRDASGETKHVPATYSRLGRIRLTADARTHVVPVSIYESGEHVLELFNATANVHLHALRIFPTPVTHTMLLKGGAKAEMTESLASADANSQMTFTIHNDLPALRIAWQAMKKNRRIGLLDKARFTKVKTHGDGLTFLANDALTPAMHVLVERSDDRARLEDDGSAIWLAIPPGRAMTVHLAVDAGCIKSMTAEAIATGLRKPMKTLALPDDDKPARIRHAGQLPVQVVKIVNPRPGPYFVRENGWWRQRGAQPITDPQDERAHCAAYRDWVVRNEALGDTREALAPFAYRRHTADLPPARATQGDYLKVYTAADDALILPHGFIGGTARPGFGCQYTMALADVQGDASQSSLRVKVMRLTAYIFAPRVRFARPVAAVTLDGKPWHYFDGELVMLPQQRGVYQLEVTHGQTTTPATPAITRTSASITDTQLAERSFEFSAALPEYVRKLPHALEYHAAISLPSDIRRIQLQGASIARRDGQGVILRFKPGRVRFTW